MAASRRGHHANALLPSHAPTLLSGLLCGQQHQGTGENVEQDQQQEAGGEAGVCFLLRWCLDQAVSEFARSGGASAQGGEGASLAVVSECLRALSCLLSDEKGEVSLVVGYNHFRFCNSVTTSVFLVKV